MNTLTALRKAAEYDEDGWGMVYLDNAHAKLPGMSPTVFRAHLASLSKNGLYKPVDGYAWGMVKMD
jgi:hypothetical protein